MLQVARLPVLLALPALLVTEPGAQGGAGATIEETAQSTLDEESVRDWRWGEDFHPDVNVYGNFLARKDTLPLYDENGEDFTDTGRLRQVDLILGSPIAEGVSAFLAAAVQSDLANNGFEIEFEQAYLRLEQLPLVGELPEDSSVVLGQFRTKFGRLNQERVYDLPQINRPRALTQFFGENGYAELGASGDFRLFGTDAGALRFTAEYLDSGSEPLTLEGGGATGGLNFHLGWASDPAAEHGVELGASHLHSRRADREKERATVLGIDALYSHRGRPGEGPGFFLGGEWLAGEIDQVGGGVEKPGSFYLWSQLRLDETWYVGARFDVSEELDDDSLSTRTAGAVVGYVASPHLRYAIAVDRTESDVDALDGATRAFGEINFSMGTNPERPFWRR